MQQYNVLFLCTGNSARSMAEALLNFWGRGRFTSYSAGSQAKGEVHPWAIKMLQRNNLPIDQARNKSWEKFATPAAPPLHFVFTVCDHAAAEVCPVLPGQPMTAHWGIHDPAAVEGPIWNESGRSTNRELDVRIKIFTSLRLDMLDDLSLKQRLNEIGKIAADPASSDSGTVPTVVP
jgi:arsenate reductase (thioredoxin)